MGYHEDTPAAVMSESELIFKSELQTAGLTVEELEMVKNKVSELFLYSIKNESLHLMHSCLSISD